VNTDARLFQCRALRSIARETEIIISRIRLIHDIVAVGTRPRN